MAPDEGRARWREYVRKGPADFDDFVAVEGNAWKWDGGRDQ